MDVAAWLQGLSLERYEQLFREHQIDGRVLPSLTADDLKEIGVAAVGHRRRLLEAIAALRAAAEPAPALPRGEGAERRQLTVMFCDLVGSTALSARLDPEDLRAVLGAYHSAVADEVGHFGGYVAKYLGDGVLAYFGYPQAHEDDAERAVRAGLAVIAAVGRLATAERLNVRLGVASGLVVVGDLLGAGATQEREVIGETPNLAARLQGLARPGTLVIAEGTRRQIGALFEIEDLGLQRVAGLAEPQRAWCVLGESGVVSRFEALRSPAAPLVGRDHELDLLLRHWQQSKTGKGRVVLLSGEAGIGKSRLAAALAQRIEKEPHTGRRYFCSPHHQVSALHPFVVQIERVCGLARDDRVDRKLEKLRDVLATAARGDDEIELLAELLALPNAAAELNYSPQRKREKLLEGLLHQLEAAALGRPLLILFEDAHWIDPTSRELLGLVIDRAPRRPVLLVITFRPEFEHGWGSEPHVTALNLGRLAGRDGATLVARLAGNARFTPETVDEIVERAEGVPLFVEELTKAVIEAEDRGLPASAGPDLAIPPTLHASLIARLDRLGPIAREIGQIGAVLGREFGYELIARVARRSAAELETGLDRLADAGLLFCRGAAPDSAYLFKHALVQDAAYSTLLRSSRQELHARVAAVLEQHFADLVERQPELLAHHLTAARDTECAVDQWLKAGRRAAQRLAHLEAIRHFDHGLTLVGSLAQAAERDRLEAELQLARGLSLITKEGFISPAANQAYRRARELGERLADPRQLFTAVYGLWQWTAGSGDLIEGRKLSETLLGLTATQADDGLRLQAHHSAWATCLHSGLAAASREHSSVGRRLYDPDRHRSHRLLFGGHDPGVCANMFHALAGWVLGYPEQALASGAEGLALAQQLAHPLSLEDALLNFSLLHLGRGEPELALQRLDAAQRLAAEQRLGFVREPLFLRGDALIAQGAVQEGVDCLQQGLGTPVGRAVWRTYGLASLANGLMRLAKTDQALAAIGEGLQRMEEKGERLWASELYRIKGLILVRRNDLEGGQTALEAALLAARRREARAYELRAAIGLARLWGEQGRRAEARQLLASVYDRFTEGFDTADLKEAKELLDELA